MTSPVGKPLTRDSDYVYSALQPLFNGLSEAEALTHNTGALQGLPGYHQFPLTTYPLADQHPLAKL